MGLSVLPEPDIHIVVSDFGGTLCPKILSDFAEIIFFNPKEV